jgi:hypothetical protein
MYIFKESTTDASRLHVLGLRLILCGLFNNAFSSSDYIASDDRMINEQ